TWAQLAVSMLAGAAFWAGWLFVGGWLTIVAGTLDVLDGGVARQAGVASPRGALVDSLVDRCAEFATFLGLGAFFRDSWIVLAVAVACFRSFVVSSPRAPTEARGARSASWCSCSGSGSGSTASGRGWPSRCSCAARSPGARACGRSGGRRRAALSSRRRAGDNARRPEGPGRNRLRNALRLTAGIAVSLACLYFATRGTDWTRVGAVLVAARPLWIVAVTLASLATVYIRAQRWRVLLRPVGDVPLYPALSATAIGFGASAVLPFRAGEFLRPALLGRRVGVRMSAAFSSVVLVRLFDMLLVIGCFLRVAVVYPDVPPDSGLGAVGLALAGVLGLNGLGGLGDLPTVLLVLAYSAYLWGVIALTYLFSFLALDVHVPLVAASLTTVVVVAAMVFLPQAPGFVGTWQAGCVLALSWFHVGHDVAVGYSLLTWVIQMVVNIATAGIFLAREDLPLGRLLRLAAREAPAAG